MITTSPVDMKSEEGDRDSCELPARTSSSCKEHQEVVSKIKQLTEQVGTGVPDIGFNLMNLD